MTAAASETAAGGAAASIDRADALAPTGADDIVGGVVVDGNVPAMAVVGDCSSIEGGGEADAMGAVASWSAGAAAPSSGGDVFTAAVSPAAAMLFATGTERTGLDPRSIAVAPVDTVPSPEPATVIGVAVEELSQSGACKVKAGTGASA